MSERTREPLSWLMLERYALGEVSADERARIEARLAESAEDRACLEEIRADVGTLPALPVVPIGRAGSKRRRILGISTVLAAAAALLLMFRPHHAEVPAIDDGSGVKGNDVALTVLSDRQPGPAHTFSPGERFKLLLTCPPGHGGELLPVVFQAGQRFEPLPRAPAFPCGNREPWPGAFTLDGSEPAWVCVAFTEAARAATDPSALGRGGVCVKLEAAP